MDSGYSATPLPAKLGIRSGHRVLLVGAPAGFDLAGLPEGVVLHRRPGRSPYDVAVVFCQDRAALADRWPRTHACVTAAGRLWVAWPKRASGRLTDR